MLDAAISSPEKRSEDLDCYLLDRNRFSIEVCVFAMCRFVYLWVFVVDSQFVFDFCSWPRMWGMQDLMKSWRLLWRLKMWSNRTLPVTCKAHTLTHSTHIHTHACTHTHHTQTHTAIAQTQTHTPIARTHTPIAHTQSQSRSTRTHTPLKPLLRPPLAS